MRNRLRYLLVKGWEWVFWRLASLFMRSFTMLDRCKNWALDGQLWAIDHALNAFQASLPSMPTPDVSDIAMSAAPEVPAQQSLPADAPIASPNGALSAVSSRGVLH